MLSDVVQGYMAFTVYDINSSNEGEKLGQSQAYSKLIGHIYLDVSSSFLLFFFQETYKKW